MPMVRIELYPGRTPEQKVECARSVIDALVTHLKVAPEACEVMFVDVAKHDWLLGGKLPPTPAKG